MRLSEKRSSRFHKKMVSCGERTLRSIKIPKNTFSNLMTFFKDQSDCIGKSI